MKKILILSLLAAIAVLIVLKYAFFRVEPFEKERRERVAMIEQLLAANADYVRVTNALRIQLCDCSVGSPDRWRLESFLAAEPTNSRPAFRQSVAKYPRVYDHSTEHSMTWLFFDADGFFESGYVCPR